MTKLQKMVSVGAAVLVMVGTSITAFAETGSKTPAQAVAELTGKTVESVIAEKAKTGKTYGTLAMEAGKWDEFKMQALERKKDFLKAQVAAGKMTQERADAIQRALEENQKNCDGTRTAKIGQKLGAKFGSSGQGLGTNGAGQGLGTGPAGGGRMGMQGTKRGQGSGGMGLRDGSCNTTGN